MPVASTGSGSRPGSSSVRPNTGGGNGNESFMDAVFGSGDGIPNSVTRQMIYGGLSGWVTGFLAMKVGKAVAIAVGGGIIILQIANHQGYINVI